MREPASAIASPSRPGPSGAGQNDRTSPNVCGAGCPADGLDLSGIIAACPSIFNHDTEHLVPETDEAVQCHMAWARGLLRGAVLRSSPGDDARAEEAHRGCPFGHWLQRHRERFDELDAVTVRYLHDRHRQMHNALRCIGRRIPEGEVGDAGEFDRVERTQTDIVADLVLLKNAYLAHSPRLDALTGLPLRYGLEEAFEQCCARAHRHEERLVAL